MKTQVLVVEDNKYMLHFLSELVQKEEQYVLAGELRDADQVLPFCKKEKVNLILMGVQTLHGHSGLSAARTLRETYPDIKVLVVTSLVDPEVLRQAKEYGVDSLWYKDHGEEEILDVMERTLAGESVFPDRSPNVEIGKAWSDDLSDMQKKILRLYIQGNSYAAIARKCFIEEVTVKYHMGQMIQKCGFQTKQQLVAAAIDSTLITNISCS